MSSNVLPLLEADERELVESNIDSEQYMRFIQKHPNLYKVRCFYENLVSLFQFHVVCRMLDHDIKMDGWFGPDSGGEDWWCARCGRIGGHHIYY
jgi:hypothetical protein